MKNDGIWFIDLGKRKENSSLSNRKVVFLTELTGGEALEERGKGWYNKADFYFVFERMEKETHGKAASILTRV